MVDCCPMISAKIVGTDFGPSRLGGPFTLSDRPESAPPSEQIGSLDAVMLSTLNHGRKQESIKSIRRDNTSTTLQS
jgi:hypothetical protein